MQVTMRPARPGDAPDCGRICHDAFAAIAVRHGFPPDFPSVEVATAYLSELISHPSFFALVAEYDGRIVGSNFLDERSTVLGVGPITVDPQTQDRGIGRALMNEVLNRSAQKHAPGVRLVQAAYHNRSLSLYAKLGFDVREPLAVMQGDPPAPPVPGTGLRAATDADFEACNALCSRVHGHDRGGELLDALARGTAELVERDGRITGYTTGIGYVGHAVAESNDDLTALISHAESFFGPGVLVPLRNGELLRWCLQHRLRMVYTMSLMTIGEYHEPRGAYLASVLY